MGCLMDYKDENRCNLTDEQIADNVIGVLFAAQDTTASALTWILKYLHDYPSVLEHVKVWNYGSDITMFSSIINGNIDYRLIVEFDAQILLFLVG